jgi:hypothetical protein
MKNREEIELILIEASSYGLRQEVVETAQSYIDEGYSELDAYEMAFDEWVK